jgi:YHS domain-containing protein/MFS family permease
MDGDEEHAVAYEGRTYLFCGARHEAGFRADPAGVIAAARAEEETPAPGLGALRSLSTWKKIADTMLADVEMLRNELVLGFVVAGFAAALVPPVLLSGALAAIGRVPFAGYPLLLISGLLIAVVTFVCSMGNVPIARFLAMAGIPLGANTTFIYGDLLIPPLVAIYRKSFPPRLVGTFLGLFVVGALVAGALMDVLFGRTGGAMSTMGSTSFSGAFTLVSNVVALIALAGVIVAARMAAASTRPSTSMPASPSSPAV